jgi:hypothetical protein
MDQTIGISIPSDDGCADDDSVSFDICSDEFCTDEFRMYDFKAGPSSNEDLPDPMRPVSEINVAQKCR